LRATVNVINGKNMYQYLCLVSKSTEQRAEASNLLWPPPCREDEEKTVNVSIYFMCRNNRMWKTHLMARIPAMRYLLCLATLAFPSFVISISGSYRGTASMVVIGPTSVFSFRYSV
jgi:hypothetical protein